MNIKDLEKLPDGIFITDSEICASSDIYRIEDGKVTELAPIMIDGIAETKIVGGHQDPKDDNS